MNKSLSLSLVTFSVAVAAAAAISCTDTTIPFHVYPLSLLHGDYAEATFLGAKYSLSACEGVVAPSVRCPNGTCAGYQIDGAGGCWCLGTLDSAQILEIEGGLQITFFNGSSSSGMNRSMTITLLCAAAEAKPSMVDETRPFHYEFVWATPAACGRPIPKPSCGQIVIDGTTFDLSSLHSDSVDNVVFPDGNSYSINPCEVPPTTSGVCPSSLTCAVFQSHNGSCSCLGLLTNSEHQYVNKTLKLKYFVADDQPATIITVLCSNLEAKPTSMVVDDNGDYNFVWVAPAGCPVVGKGCETVVVGTQRYNLTGFHNDFRKNLPLFNGNFTLSACEAVPAPLPSCPMIDRCVAYQVTADGECYCLGDADHVSRAIVAGRLVLTYNGGTDNRTTVIQTLCASPELPPTQVIENPPGVYKYSWIHPSACAMSHTGKVVSLVCEAIDSITNRRLTVSPIGQRIANVHQDRKKDELFVVSACGPAAVPNGCAYRGAPCMGFKQFGDSENCLCLGTVASGTWEVDSRGFLQASYEGTTQMGGLQMASKVTFMCGAANDVILSEVNSSSKEITHKFTWLTPEACC